MNLSMLFCFLCLLFFQFGAVGYVSKIIDGFYPCYIIKIDVDTKEPIRDPITGLCILCEPNEPGHLVARIGSNDPFRMFDGYVNSEASEKKIIRNVLRKGDLWFASGKKLLNIYHCYVVSLFLNATCFNTITL